MGPPGWIVGPAVATGTLMFVMTLTPLLALGMIGFLLVPAIAMWAGATAASLLDNRRFNTIIVVVTTLVVYAVFITRLQSQAPPPGTSYGGPSMPAPARGGPTVVPQ
jgi:ACR3 family arsenite efflux pump ArsB